MCFFIQDQQWTCWSVGETMKKLERRHICEVTLNGHCPCLSQVVPPTCSCWGAPRCSHSHSLPSRSTCPCGRYVQQGRLGHWHIGAAAAPGPGPLLTDTSGQTSNMNVEHRTVKDIYLLKAGIWAHLELRIARPEQQPPIIWKLRPVIMNAFQKNETLMENTPTWWGLNTQRDSFLPDVIQSWLFEVCKRLTVSSNLVKEDMSMTQTASLQHFTSAPTMSNQSGL